MRAERLEGCLAGLRCDYGEQLAFVGDVERIDAENLAGAGDRGPNGDRRLLDHDAAASGACKLVECRRGHAAARRIAHPVQCSAAAGSEQGGGELVEGGIALDLAFELELAARTTSTAIPWSAIVPDNSTRSPGRTSPAPRCACAGTRPMPAVVMYRPSALPRSTTFVSPVAIGTPASRVPPRRAEPMQRSSSATSRPSSRISAAESASGRAPQTARQVVDRAVHGELRDVAAREARRLDNVAIGAEGEARASFELEYGTVAERLEQRVAQLVAAALRPAPGSSRRTGAVRERDALVEQPPGPALATGLEPAEDLALLHQAGARSLRRRAESPVVVAAGGAGTFA